MGNVDIDLEKLDRVVNEHIPAGFNIHEQPVADYDFGFMAPLKDKDYLHRSIGTLGGGNHFIELQISETGTKIIYEAPQDKTFSYGALGMVIEDENGNILAKPVSGSMLDYVYEGDDGKTYNVYVLPSIYFEDISKIRIHITDCFCALFDDEVEGKLSRSRYTTEMRSRTPIWGFPPNMTSITVGKESMSTISSYLPRMICRSLTQKDMKVQTG